MYRIFNKPARIIIAMLIGVGVGFLVYKNNSDVIIPAARYIYAIVSGFVATCLVTIFGNGLRNPLFVKLAMEWAGIANKAGHTPTLSDVKKDCEMPKGFVLVFNTHGVPLEVFLEKKNFLQSALNLYIDRIEYGKNLRQILIYAVPAQYGLPDYIEWRPEYLSEKEMEIVLGKSVSRMVTVDMNVIPHILIGGSTGSGKTVLFKNIIMQCLSHGASIHLGDFKGGIDFTDDVWRKCDFMCNSWHFREMLKQEVAELEARKAELYRAGCANISEYNRKIRNTYRHIVIACDEIVDLLDTSGVVDKESKEFVKEVTGYLSTIARQGRAFGIHLILGTQRPSADMIPGQIRSNIDCRICGRADHVLSQIVLDNTSAATEIPKTGRGRFIMSDGTVFQGFYDDRE